MTSKAQDQTTGNTASRSPAGHIHVGDVLESTPLTDSAEGCGNSPADSGVVGRQNPVCQDTEPAAIERRGDSSADSDSVGRQNVVCQDTQQDYRETHEIATSTSSLKKRFYLNYHETLVTVQLNPVVDIEEMYVMKLDVTDAI